MTIIVSNCWTV